MEIDKVVDLKDMTPEDVEKHMQDGAWGEIVEVLLDEFLENSDTLSMNRAFALNSMFVQTSYLSMLFQQLQKDAQRMYEISMDVRDALFEKDPKNHAILAWDEAMATAQANIDSVQ